MIGEPSINLPIQKKGKRKRRGEEEKGWERKRRRSLKPSLMSLSTQEAKAGGLQVQGLPGLQREFKANLGNLVRSPQTIKKKVG